MRVGRSLTQRPKSAALTRCLGCEDMSSKIQKTLFARNSATSRVIPLKRCMKKGIGSARNDEKELQAPSAVSDQGLW
jgi:hypothetical protein